MIELAAVDKTYTCLGDLAFEYTFIARVTEDPHIHRMSFVEEIVERYVIDKILGKILISVGVGRIIAADDDLEPVVEQSLRHLIAVARRL